LINNAPLEGLTEIYDEFSLSFCKKSRQGKNLRFSFEEKSSFNP